MLLETRVGRPADVRGSVPNAPRSERRLYLRSDWEHTTSSNLRPDYDYVVEPEAGFDWMPGHA